MKNQNTGYFVYMLRCADGSLYVGWTTNLVRRVVAHNAGEGAKYTRSRRPAVIVFAERHPDKHSAMSREYQIKQYSHAQKMRLLA